MATNQSSWTLRKKLLLAFLSAGMLPLIVGGFIANYQASNALEQAAFKQLESIRDIKRSEIENYFRTIRDQVLTLSENSNTVFAMNTLKKTFHSERDMKKTGAGDLENARKKLADYYQNQYGAEYQKQNSKGIDLNSLIPETDVEVYRQFRYIADNPNPLARNTTWIMRLYRANNTTVFTANTTQDFEVIWKNSVITIFSWLTQIPGISFILFSRNSISAPAC